MVGKRVHCLESLPVWAALVWAVILTGPANGITIRVPQDYAKITDALLWATNGDEIVVSPGVYVENIDFRGKNVILRSTNPTDSATVAATIIDGNKKGSVVTFAGTETSSCVLAGFTIRNGYGSDGAGIYGRGTKARIEHNTISGNSSSRWGGGVSRCGGAIQNNVITGNVASYEGGGLYACDGAIQNNAITSNSASGSGGSEGGGLFACNGTIQNNVISGNSAGEHGGAGLYGCNGTIQNNVISGNSTSGPGGGLYQCNGTIQNNVITSNSARGTGSSYGGGLYGCNSTIRNNTISGNSATGQGGGLYGCTGVTVNCIIWGNTAPVYSQISYHSIPNYSCIQGYTVGQGQGNIGLNPRFVGPNDFHLLSGSPCIDDGTNANCPATDKDGNKRPLDGNGDGKAVCDMGAYEYVPPRPTAVPLQAWSLYR